MPSPSALLALPASMLLLLTAQASAKQAAPTALRRVAPDSGEKIFAHHLAFAPLSALAPREAASAAIAFLDEQDAELFHKSNTTTSRYRPAFERHYEDAEDNVLRRAAEALALLQRRQSCPSGMNSCSKIGSPNKCCQEGTYCTDVSDTGDGQVACCPDGASCGGAVGKCPTEARSCPAELGGGCCIPGYVCQGVGCIPSALATPESSTATASATSTAEQVPTTITTTQTTWVEGIPSTVVVTLIVTQHESAEPNTRTTTEYVTASATEEATGAAPWRPTGTSQVTSAPPTTSAESGTQTGCPTGFYGCLAKHGGGCCQTDRDCNTHSCPAPSSTTIISDGATLVVPVADVPTASATATCADGWFMCGQEAGPVAGCCPSGYNCGTASCYTSEASQTAKVQKELPDSASAQRVIPWVALGGLAGAWLLRAMA